METALSMLERAILVQKEREQQYKGSAVGRFEQIAGIASILASKTFSASDVAAILLSLKIDRAKLNPCHVDSGVDGVNYLAFWIGELIKEESTLRTQQTPSGENK